MAKRTQASRPTKGRRPEDSKLAPQPERHSGEGSASALETLQKMEQGRFTTGPSDPDDEPTPER